MRAVLDWSYGLLSEDEQPFFRGLGIFTGGFTVEAAAAVVMNAADQRVNVIDRLADLVAKSLVAADVGGTEPRFRLLDTTRAYALEKLDESGERERIARRHAEYYRNLLERAEGEATARPAGEWLADYAREIDNLRAALDWAFSPGGDGSIGVALTTAAVPLWMRLSLLQERGSRAKQALGALETGGTRDPRKEMRLHDALGASATEAHEMGVAFTKELDIAEDLGDREYQLRALWGLYFYHTGSSRYRAALQSAQKFHDLAKTGSDPNTRLRGERMIGAAKHFLGDQISAQCHLEQVLAHAATDHGRDVIRFGHDLRVSARVFLSRVLWMQGFSDQAMRIAETSIVEAQATGHDFSVCYALAMGACQIALWVGNLSVAARYVRLLLEYSGKDSLPLLLHAIGARFYQVIVLKGGDLDAGSWLPPPSDLDEIVESHSGFRFLSGLSDLAEALADTGRIAEALALVETGIEQFEEGWLTPELLRLKGELLLLQGTPAAAEKAEDLFRQALDAAGRQAALSWELRAATSLARLLRDQGRSADAIACLQPIYDRFTEGFGTADLIAAKQLLESTSSQPN
jgi:predicted ATPase